MAFCTILFRSSYLGEFLSVFHRSSMSCSVSKLNFECFLLWRQQTFRTAFLIHFELIFVENAFSPMFLISLGVAYCQFAYCSVNCLLIIVPYPAVHLGGLMSEHSLFRFWPCYQSSFKTIILPDAFCRRYSCSRVLVEEVDHGLSPLVSSSPPEPTDEKRIRWYLCRLSHRFWSFLHSLQLSLRRIF